MLVPGSGETSNDAIQAQDSAEKTGILQKTTSWVKENPGKSLLVAGGIIGGGYLIMRTMRSPSATHGLDGLPKKRKRKRKGYSGGKKNKVKAQILL